MVVYPRLVAAGQHAPISSERVSSNVAGLDAMLQGGLEPGTTTLILGPAGVGKSTVAFQYAASAVGQGHHAVVYAFEEVARILLGRAEKLCGPIVREAHADGRLHVQQVDTAEMSPGQFAEAVRRSVLGNQARLIVIDSLNGYVSSMLEEKMLAVHLHELFAFLNQQGVVTVVVAAQHGLINAREAEVEVSYLADTVLVLNNFEAMGEIRQSIGVFKRRTGPHERTLRELKISSEGIIVGEPLRGFQGIMTGVPRYEGGTRLVEDSQ